MLRGLNTLSNAMEGELEMEDGYMLAESWTRGDRIGKGSIGTALSACAVLPAHAAERACDAHCTVLRVLPARPAARRCTCCVERTLP